MNMKYTQMLILTLTHTEVTNAVPTTVYTILEND